MPYLTHSTHYMIVIVFNWLFRRFSFDLLVAQNRGKYGNESEEVPSLWAGVVQ